ncbi:MAG: hypothetical protein Q9198_007247 [Flavoplaca austrocitrina]
MARCSAAKEQGRPETNFMAPGGQNPFVRRPTRYVLSNPAQAFSYLTWFIAVHFMQSDSKSEQQAIARIVSYFRQPTIVRLRCKQYDEFSSAEKDTSSKRRE